MADLIFDYDIRFVSDLEAVEEKYGLDIVVSCDEAAFGELAALEVVQDLVQVNLNDRARHVDRYSLTGCGRIVLITDDLMSVSKPDIDVQAFIADIKDCFST